MARPIALGVSFFEVRPSVRPPSARSVLNDLSVALSQAFRCLLRGASGLWGRLSHVPPAKKLKDLKRISESSKDFI